MRYYYAAYNYYGIYAGGIARDMYYAFSSASARDDFVAANEWDGRNIVWTSCTRRDVVAGLGKDFWVDACAVEGGAHPCYENEN